MTTQQETNVICGYQLIVGREIANHKTHSEACAAFFAAAMDKSAPCALYSLMSEGGIGGLVLENKAHYEQRDVPCKPALVLVKECEAEIRRLRSAKSAA